MALVRPDQPLMRTMNVRKNSTVSARDEYSTSRPTGASGGAGDATAWLMIWRWLGITEMPDQTMGPSDERKLTFPTAASTKGTIRSHGRVAAATDVLVRTDQSR